MSLEDLNACFIKAQEACDKLLSHEDGRLPYAFVEAYSSKVEKDASFSSYKTAKWFGDSSVVEFTTRRTNKRIFFPAVGFLIASRLVPYYLELLKYRNSVISILADNGKCIEDVEDSNGNVDTCVFGYVESSNRVSKNEKEWLKKFLAETKNSSPQWWGKGKEIKRTNDFFVSPLMKVARLNAETQSEIADIAKQLAECTELRKILEVREAQNKSEDKKDEVPPADLLAVALKLFKEKRRESGEGGWFDVSLDVNHFIRKYFDPLTLDKIKGFGYQEIYGLFCGKNESFSKTFEPMWSGKNGQGWGHIKLGNEDEIKEIVEFLVDLKANTHIATEFLVKGFGHPSGFGSSVITELLMKFHPESCIKHGEKSHDALRFLGLVDFDWRSNYSDAEYKQICGAAAKILQKMQVMKIARQINSDGSEDNSPPDYLTANEFIYFVNTNQDLIKEQVMKAQLKTVNSKAKVKHGTRSLKDAMSDDMLKHLAAALRTKPFAILAGHSGTGKSQLVRRLAYMTCNNEILIKEGEGKSAPGNYCMVQVKPNWHDSTDLLGYYSEMGGRHFVNTPFVEFICKAYAYPETPFFVCLDEMNLAPVEQYFAEYLSAIESMEKKGVVWVTDALVEVDKTGESDADGRKKVDSEIVGQIMKSAASTEAAEWIQAHGLTIPKNLFVVGTVNMDETTCQFSRKVLDRAMTLLMNDVKFSEMANSKKPSEEELLNEDGIKFFLEGEETGAVGEIESGLLNGINEPLSNTPFVIAYRFANEYALYEAAWAKLDGFDLTTVTEEEKKELAAKALDHVVMMKLLPRIHGERRVVEGIFNGRKVKVAGSDKDLPGLKAKLSSGLSAKMMDEILARRDEYLTFWP